ncbi:MAG: RNA helicase, partial [Thermoplasmataceae archaeon]
SEIRTIQRRGRTGRLHAGRVKILLYEGTRDIGYYYSSVRKEGRMRSNITSMKESFDDNKRTKREKNKNINLDDF